MTPVFHSDTIAREIGQNKNTMEFAVRYYLVGSELLQFNQVVDCYRSYVMSAQDDLAVLPDQFKTEEDDVGYLGTTWLMSQRKKRVLYQYTVNCFHLSFWELPPTTLIPIRNALYALCAYQLNRKERSVASGHLQDPTNLVCEQLKHWLFYLARHSMDDYQALLLDIKKHMTYVKALEKNNVFPPSKIGVKYERTMNATLLEVAGCLERASDEINESVRRRSLRDVVSSVTRYTVSVVDGSLQYLFYILRSNKTPAAINIQTIKDGHYESLNKIRNTRSFKLLELLLNSPYVKYINRQTVTEFVEQDVFSSHVGSMRIVKYAEEGVVNSEQSRERFYLNRVLGGNLIPDRNLLRRWIFDVHSGIDMYFQNKYTLLKSFVALHAMVERIAQFSMICKNMEELIDYFGTKIWAELGGKILDYFQEAFRRLNNEYREHIQNIHAVAHSRYDELVQGGRGGAPHWRANYNSADRLYGHMLRDMELALEQMSHISVVVDKVKAQRYTPAIQHKFDHVILSLNQFGLFFDMPSLEYRTQDPLPLAIGSA